MHFLARDKKSKSNIYLRCLHWSVWLVWCYLSHLLPNHALILRREITSLDIAKIQCPLPGVKEGS